MKKQRKDFIYWIYDYTVMAARKRNDKLNKALKSLVNYVFTIKHAYNENTKQEFNNYFIQLFINHNNKLTTYLLSILFL